MAVKDFLGRPAPPGYVAGLGRGAVGFTTRSDIGPAREDVSASSATTDGAATGADDQQDNRFADNEEGLLASQDAAYDQDDEEADEIYARIDEQMEKRRRAKREERMKKEAEEERKNRPQIHAQFAELKRGLSQVSQDEWENLPEPGDLRAVGKKMRRLREKEKEREKYTPTPDSLLASARAQLSTSNTASVGVAAPGMDMDGTRSVVMGSSSGTASTLANFQEISKARDDLLKVNLDRLSGAASTVGSGSGSGASGGGENGSGIGGGSTTVDPKGYLTALSSVVVKSDAEIGDIKKARELLKSVVTTNPKHAPGWIAAARLEELDGKLAHARQLIATGCQHSPKNEDIWLEAARLNTPKNAQIILANAVKELPHSVKLWSKAAEIEQELPAKKRVLRRALESIPHSVKLWMAAVDLEEDPDDARVLLSRAVECVPLSVDLWLALSRLEVYDNAKRVLNRARVACPTSPDIWVAAARLEESAEHEERAGMIIQRAMVDLEGKGANWPRERWLQEAEVCERSGAVHTVRAIVQNLLMRDRHPNGENMGGDDGMVDEEEDVDLDELIDQWLDDAALATSHKATETARAIYDFILAQDSSQAFIWQKAAFFEKENGTPERLHDIMERAVAACPGEEVLWLMAAKWSVDQVDEARKILQRAFKANPNSEKIWLAAVKLEQDLGEYNRARALLAKARDEASTERVWLKSVMLERNLENTKEAKEILLEAIEKYRQYPKFWMIRGQMETEAGNIDAARQAYSEGTKECSSSIPLWLLWSRLEESQKNLTRCRAILDKARLLHPQEPLIWLEMVRVEHRSGNTQQAKVILSQSLQKCPKSGILWSESIFLEPRPARKSKSVDALKQCTDQDPHVLLAVARLFWSERHIEKARAWLERTTRLQPSLGDAWAYWYRLEMQYGQPAQQKEVMDRCCASEPRYGELWTGVSKRPGNWRMKTGEVLSAVAALVPVDVV